MKDTRIIVNIAKEDNQPTLELWIKKIIESTTQEYNQLTDKYLAKISAKIDKINSTYPPTNKRDLSFMIIEHLLDIFQLNPILYQKSSSIYADLEKYLGGLCNEFRNKLGQVYLLSNRIRQDLVNKKINITAETDKKIYTSSRLITCYMSNHHNYQPCNNEGDYRSAISAIIDLIALRKENLFTEGFKETIKDFFKLYGKASEAKNLIDSVDMNLLDRKSNEKHKPFNLRLLDQRSIAKTKNYLSM